MSNLITRTITGVLFVAIMVAALLYNKYSAFAVFGVIVVFSIIEFCNIIRNSKTAEIPKWVPVLGTVVFVMGTAKLIFNIDLIPLIPVILSVPFLWELFRIKNSPATNISLMILPVIYIVLPFILLINSAFQPEFEGKIILGFFTLIWANDTFAYIFGVSLGKHRLYEKVSPKKSWEGFVGGVVSTLVFAYFMPKLLNLDVIHSTVWMLAAITVSISGTLGDLVESLIKRSVNIKDSGNFLPGHGGFMDRFDAAFIAAPFFSAIIYYSKYFIS